MHHPSSTFDNAALQLCMQNAALSLDPSTQVGAVIIGPDGTVRATGHNSFPAGIAATEDRLTCRVTKLDLMVHAEMNAILRAARLGRVTEGCTLYVVAKDRNGGVWGGPPCARCAVEVIQAGIVEVVSRPSDGVPDRWRASIDRSRKLLEEAGLGYREVKF